MTVVANTTVISNISAVGRIDLLRELHGTLRISVQVYEEIQKGIEEGYGFYAETERNIHPFSDTGWIRLTGMADDEEFAAFRELSRRLGKGEASCLSIAARRKWLFLTDDLAARKQAAAMGVPVSGTLGCLLMAVEKGLCALEQANRRLREMTNRGYRSPVRDLTELR